MTKPELLAPAGNLEKMKTAFAFGADAVYLGIPDFSLRVRINDFDLAKIKQAVKYAHKIDKKVYVTLNIFAHNYHFKKLGKYINELKKIKPDGLFISDPGIMLEIKKHWLKANIILSTQANCTNWQSAKFWQSQGMSRVILGREVSLAEIEEIRKELPKLELECFVHGALCMAYSGRCFLSKYLNGRDANLGDCVQPCRWEYFIKSKGHDEVLEIVEEKHGSYLLNSQDLCLIKRLPEIIEARLSALKIEGRAKSVYYLANVIGAYRKAIDLIFENETHPKADPAGLEKIKDKLEFLYSELETKLFHRGFTEGFMFGQGKSAQNLENSHNRPKWEFCGQVLKSVKIKNKFQIYIKVHNALKIGDEIEIVSPPYDVKKINIKKIIDSKNQEEIKEAHGGSAKTIIILELGCKISKYSVLRRLGN